MINFYPPDAKDQIENINWASAIVPAISKRSFISFISKLYVPIMAPTEAGPAIPKKERTVTLCISCCPLLNTMPCHST